MTGADLEAFLDGLMPPTRTENIAGAVIAVVKDGQVFSPRVTDTPTWPGARP